MLSTIVRAAEVAGTTAPALAPRGTARVVQSLAAANDAALQRRTRKYAHSHSLSRCCRMRSCGLARAKNWRLIVIIARTLPNGVSRIILRHAHRPIKDSVCYR